jgi:hypothetical protein
MTLDSDELKLLEQTAAELLDNFEGRRLVDELSVLGWFELWERQPRQAARALFYQQGRLAKTSSMLSLLMGAAMADVTLSGTDGAQPGLLPGPAASDGGGWCTPRPDGRLVMLAQSEALQHGGYALLAVRRGNQPQLLRVAVDSLLCTGIDGLDPAMRLCWVDATPALAAAEQVAAGEDSERRWEGALALGRRVLAQEMLGVVAEQLRLAVRHALDRSQFGRPIGSFQAIQHKLADVYVGLTVADLATDEAWHDPNPSTCVLAKLLAGAAVDAANLHCQQVLGGIGFTWEHPFHRYLRRGRMLATMLGRRPQLAAALGSEIVRSQRLGDLAPL